MANGERRESPSSPRMEASAGKLDGEERGSGRKGASPDLDAPSPTAAWLGEAGLVDCFGVSTSRHKLDQAEMIGVSRVCLALHVVLFHVCNFNAEAYTGVAT